MHFGVDPVSPFLCLTVHSVSSRGPGCGLRKAPALPVRQSEARESAGARATQKPNFHAAGASGEAAGAGPSPPCWNRSRYFPFCTLSRILSGQRKQNLFSIQCFAFFKELQAGSGEVPAGATGSSPRQGLCAAWKPKRRKSTLRSPECPPLPHHGVPSWPHREQ